MFSIRTPLKRLIKSHPKVLSTLPHYISFQNLNKPIPFSQIQQVYSFSSFQQQTIRRHTEYQEEDLALYEFEPEKLPERRKVMEKYLQCKDLSVLNFNDIALISDTLCSLAIAHNFGGNKDKALKYLKEDEDLNQKTGIRDTISLAYNFYLQGSIYLEHNNLTDAQLYLSEADRISRLLEDDQMAKDLILQCCCSFARIHYLQDDQDKALELYHSVLERIRNLPEEASPHLLIPVYEGMGLIYSSRDDFANTMEYWRKGLETATQVFGESSQDVYFFSNQIAEFLYNQDKFQWALPYAEQSLQTALQIFPKDSPEVALDYSRLGHIYTAKQAKTKALSSLKNAIQIFEKQPPQEFAEYLSSCYFHSAEIHALQGNPQEALNLLAKADPILALAFDGKELAEMYLEWAMKLQDIGNLGEKPKIYFLKALKIFESCESKGSPVFLDIYAGLGSIAYREEDWEKVCEFMKKAEGYFEVAELEPEFQKVVYSHLKTASIRLAEIADGFKYAQKVLECAEEGGGIEYVGEAHFHLGVLYEHEGKLKEALEAFKKSVVFPEIPPHSSQSIISIAQEKIAEIESKLKIVSERNV